LENEYLLQGPYTDYIKSRLFEWLDENKPDKIISGMALGVDQIWAVCGIRRNIPVIAAIPCRSHSSRWPVRSVRLYNSILGNKLVETHLVTNDTYTTGCMQVRNRWMIDNSDRIVAVWDGSSGGTANCIEAARELQRDVFVIHPIANSNGHGYFYDV